MRSLNQGLRGTGTKFDRNIQAARADEDAQMKAEKLYEEQLRVLAATRRRRQQDRHDAPEVDRPTHRRGRMDEFHADQAGFVQKLHA